MINFHLLEVVGRGSETQLQVGENSNYITWCYKGCTWSDCMSRLGFHFHVDAGAVPLDCFHGDPCNSNAIAQLGEEAGHAFIKSYKIGKQKL